MNNTMRDLFVLPALPRDILRSSMLDRLLAIELIEADNNPPLSGGFKHSFACQCTPAATRSLVFGLEAFTSLITFCAKICPSIVRFLSGSTHSLQEVRVS